MPVMISGYLWAVASGWTWPLLAITATGGPHGSNAALYDSIPLLLLRKVVRSLTGQIINPYPA